MSYIAAVLTHIANTKIPYRRQFTKVSTVFLRN